MAGKIYKGDYGVVVRVDTKINLTSSTSYTLKVKKPDGREVDWACTIEVPATGGILTYTTVSGNLDVAGTYKLYALVGFASGNFIGEVATFRVYNLWE
jgi:hypothetical protein